MLFTNDIIIKIAIAEDHVSFRELLCSHINAWENFKVILQVSNGKQLIEQLDPDNLPDLILMDLRMPEMNGYDAIKFIKKKYSHIKCIVLSMFESEETIKLIINSGAEGFINKSLDLKQIQKAVHEIIQTGYYFAGREASKLFKAITNTGDFFLQNALSDKEIIFLKLICSEKTYMQIADEMNITERHAEYIRNVLFERFNVHTRTGLVIQAVEKGLTV